MDTILPLPVIGQYKQRSRGCHILVRQQRDFLLSITEDAVSSAISVSDFFLRLAEAIFQRFHSKVSLFLID